MKITFAPLLLFLLLVSCSPESSNSPAGTENDFEVDFHFETENPQVDELFKVDIRANKGIKEVTQIYDENRSRTFFPDGALESEMYFQFPERAGSDVNLRLVSVAQDTLEKKLEIEVKRGNSVQITGLELIEFHQMGEAWDPQYDENDPERLADLVVVLKKRMLSNFSDTDHTTGNWLISEVLENEENYFWDLTDEDLYIDPEKNGWFTFNLIDLDEEGEDDLLGHATLTVELQRYNEDRPETLTIVREDLDLEMKIYLEWP